MTKARLFALFLLALGWEALPACAQIGAPPDIVVPVDVAVSTSFPVFSWNRSDAFNGMEFQLATDAGMSSIIMSSVTSNDYIHSEVALGDATTYFWRVRNTFGSWPPRPFQFGVDLSTPTASSPQGSSDGGASWSSLGAYLRSTTASVRLQVRDPSSGLLVSTPQPAGFVGQWHLDEGTGTYTLDSSSNAFIGKINGGPPWIAGRLGTALNLGGGGDYVSIPYNAKLDLRGYYTVEAWFKTSSVTGNPAIVSNYNGNGYILAASYNGTGKIGFWSENWNIWDDALACDGRWHHVAVRVSNGGYAAELLLDGISHGIKKSTPTASSDAATSIGQYNGGNYFVGGIDEVRLFNVARSSNEIIADYQSDRLGANVDGGAFGAAPYSVTYSTDAGLTWNIVRPSYLSLGGSNGDNTARWLQANNLSLVTSTGPGSATNLVAFTVSDMAGNVARSTYSVLVDTAIPVPVGPANGAFVSTSTPVLAWTPLWGGSHRIQVSQDLAFTQIIEDAVTADSFHVSTNTLTHGATYWWRVENGLNSGFWASTRSFVVDIGPPSLSAAAISADAVTWLGLPSTVYISTSIGSFRVSVQDAPAGLMVSTGLPAGLVGQFHLDEATATYVQDSSTNGYVGKLIGNPSRTAGRLGAALSFDGAADHVNIADLPPLNVAGAYTVEAWFKTSSVAGYQSIISDYNGSNGYALMASYNGNNRMSFRSNGQVDTWGAVATDGQWHHAAVSVSGTRAELFLDGVSKGTATVAAVTQGGATYIGRYYNGTNNYYFTGSIDEVRIYRAARTAAEVLADFESDQLGAHNNGKAYSVSYSTNGGVTWTLVSTASVRMTTTNNRNTSLQTLQADGIRLLTSSAPLAQTDLVALAVSDYSGQVSTAVYVVYVDTLTMAAVSTPAYPCNGCVVSEQPNFEWVGPSTRTALDLQLSDAYLLQVSSNDASFGASNIVVSITTPVVTASTMAATDDVVYLSTFTLTPGSTYYWRVAPVSRLKNLGPWSRVFSFTRDPDPPAAGAFVSVSTGGALRGEQYYNGLLSGVTVQLQVTDFLSGLAVTTRAMPGGYPPASYWFGVEYSTDAGGTWISESTSTALGGLHNGVYGMTLFNGRLYAGTGGAGFGNVVMYDGAQWNYSYSGSKSGIQSLAAYQGKLYAAQSGAAGDGDVLVCDPTVSGSPAVCDAGDWSVAFDGGREAIYALAVYGDKLYAGQGNTAGNGDIFVYDGHSWQVSLNGSQPAFYALAAYNGRLYAGQGGAAGAGKVYSFDGSSWTVSYAGVPQGIHALAVYSGRLYAGQGGAAAVLSFDGTSWTSAWTPPAPADMVSSLAPFNGKLFAGLGSAAGSGDLAVYDGASWSIPYRSDTSRIYSLMPYEGSLFMGIGGGGADGAVVQSSRRLKVGLTGTDGAAGAQTLSATGLDLVFSTNKTVCGGVSPCGATNQVRLHATDEAGNVLHAGPFAVLVDTDAPAAPPVPSVLAMSSATLRLGWGAVSSSHPVLYELQASTKSDYTGTLYSSNTAGNSAWLVGLSPSTTYYCHVRASHMYQGPFSASLTTVTWTTPVTAASVAAVYRTSATVQWTALPTGAAQGYLVTASTASDSSGIQLTSSTSNGSANQLKVIGLTRGTTYYFRVISMNWAGVGAPADAGSAWTLPGDAPGSPAVPVVYPTSATLSWASISSDGGYQAQASTVAGFSSGTIFSSATTNGSALSLTVAGLASNTTYHLRTGAIWNATTVYASPAPAVYSTLANPVSNPAVTGLYWSSITVTWTPLPTTPQSAACEGYRVEVWATPDFTGTIVSSVAVGATAGSVTLVGLSGNTTYYLRVGSLNWSGAPSYSYAGGGMTTPLPPGSPAISAVYLSSITVTWTPVGSKNGYIVQAAKSTNFSAPSSNTTASGSDSSLAVTGLSPNTTYYVRVGSLRDGITAWAYASVPAATLTNPVSGTISRVPAQSSAIVYWVSLPATPQSSACEGYRLDASSAADFSGSVASFITRSPTAGQLAATDLRRHTTYYFRLATLNWASVPTYIPAGSTVTAVGPPPSGASFGGVNRTSMTVTWSPVPAQDGYIAQLSLQSDFSGVLRSSATTTGSASALTVSGLDPNTRYYARVGSLWNGATSYTSAGNAPTQPALPGGMTFTAVNLTSVTVSWTPLPIAPQSATAEGYRLETSMSPDFSGTVASSATADVQVAALTLSSLTWNATHYFRLGSVGWDGKVVYLDPVSIKTGSISKGGQVGSSELTLSLVPAYPQVTLVTLRVPPDAFPDGTRVDMAATVAQLPAGLSNQVRLISLGSDVGVEISASGLQPSGAVTLQLTYDPARLPPSSTARQLVVATYSPSAGQWTLLPTTVDEQNHLLTCSVRHFSLFAPFVVAAADDLASVQVFPVPWEPGSGSRFDTPSVSFTALPAGARVEVFSIMGESLWEGEADGAGILRWDGRNRGGGKAASGTYIAVFTSGGRRRSHRMVVVR